MMAVNPLLSAEIFQVYPSMSASAFCHRGHIRCRQFAAESFYYHIRWIGGLTGLCPWPYFHATGNLQRQAWINFRIYLLKADQVVRPQTDP